MKHMEKLRNKKGFTLIELLTVVAILGILVLIAAPKFLGYTEKANVAKIKTDIKHYETKITLESIDDPHYTEYWLDIESSELDEINSSNKLINKKGEVVSDLDGEIKYIPNDKSVNNKGGAFVYSEENEQVYFYDESNFVDKGVIPELPAEPTPEPTPDSPVVEPDPPVVEPDPEPEPEPVVDITFDFVEDASGYVVSGKGTGYYKYTGSEEVVTIPESYEGHTFTSYYNMFNNNTVVKKVISNNPAVTNLTNMFLFTKIDGTLDLTEFNTSSVTDMTQLFMVTSANNIKFGGEFNTSNVTTMRNMFSDSNVPNLDLTSFDTKKVTTMYGMFYGAGSQSIDFSSFNTPNLTNVSMMFIKANSISTLDLSSFDFSKVDSSLSYTYNSMLSSTSLKNVYFKDNTASRSLASALTGSNSTFTISFK